MGTTSTSGWAVLWFLFGFTAIGAAAIGGGVVSLLAGAAMVVLACVLYASARTKEES